MNVFDFDTPRIIRALIAVVFTVLCVSQLSRAQTSNRQYVPADCASFAATYASLHWLMDKNVRSPLVDADPPYWNCTHEGTAYKPNVLHIAAAIELYGPPYDDYALSTTEKQVDLGTAHELQSIVVTEPNPRWATTGNWNFFWFAGSTSTSYYGHKCYGYAPISSLESYVHYGDIMPGSITACDTHRPGWEEAWRRFQRADSAYKNPHREYFRDPFDSFVARALADGLQGKNPHTNGGGNNGGGNGGGNNGGGNLGDGSGTPADFQKWTPFQATANAFDGLKACVSDKFQHLFDVAKQKFPAMFGAFVPNASINGSSNPCQDYRITMMGITKPIPFCDNPIMNAIRNIVRPALLALYMITAYIGLSRLVAWS